MNWDKIKVLKDLTQCPWCKTNNFKYIKTKSGREQCICECGCLMYESTKTLWYKVPDGFSVISDKKLEGYYEQNRN